MKPLTVLTLGTLALGSLGCKGEIRYENRPSQVQTEDTTNTKYSFDRFDRYQFNLEGSISTPIFAVTGDFDRDGDLDIAVVDNNRGLIIYENKIPQKKDILKIK